MQINVNVPAPPSANRIWKMARNKPYKSDEYRAWLAAAGWSIKEQLNKSDQRLSEPLTGDISLTMIAHPSDGREARRDVDNYLKPICDLLEDAGIIGNDRQVSLIIARRGKRMLTHHCELTVTQLPLAQSQTASSSPTD